MRVVGVRDEGAFYMGNRVVIRGTFTGDAPPSAATVRARVQLERLADPPIELDVVPDGDGFVALFDPPAPGTYYAAVYVDAQDKAAGYREIRVVPAPVDVFAP